VDELIADDNNLEVLDNDEEIKDVILNEEEVEFKTRVWTNENKDWIEAQEAKRRQAIMDLENGIVRKPRTKVIISFFFFFFFFKKKKLYIFINNINYYILLFILYINRSVTLIRNQCQLLKLQLKQQRSC